MRFAFRQFLRRGPRPIDKRGLAFGDIPLAEWGFVALYVVFASVWSLVSEAFLDWISADPVDSPALQAMSTLNFILTSGLLIYAILRRSFRLRRRAEEVSRLSHERFESVARATTDAIWDWDLLADTVWWSDGFQALFGWPDAELGSGMPAWLSRIHPDDRQRVEAGIQAVANGKGRTWSGNYRIRRQDGTYAEVLDRTHVLRDAGHRPVRIVGGLSDITEKRQAEEALARSHRQLRALSGRLQRAREEERTRIAREVHDELGQVLTALKIDLDWLERRLESRSDDRESTAVLERLVQTAEMADSALASVQRIATELRPRALDLLGLGPAVTQEVRRFGERTGLACTARVPDEDLGLSPETATSVYRILQEALTNVARHAAAKRVEVRLRRGPDGVTLEVEDDGCGPDSAAGTGRESLGLLGMRERAIAVGGAVEIGRASEAGGTRVVLSVPLAEREAVAA